MFGRKVVWGLRIEKIVCGYRSFCVFIISVVFCVGFRESGLNFGLVFCIRLEFW